MTKRTIAAALAAITLATSAGAATISNLGALPAPVMSPLTPGAVTGTFSHNVTGSNFTGPVTTWRDSIWKGTPYASSGVYDALTRGSVAYAMGGLFDSIRLVWGSMDPGNTIDFLLGGNVVDSVNGLQTILATKSTRSAYLEIFSKASFDSIVIRMPGVAFEYGNLQGGKAVPTSPAPVPLPAAGLMLAGSLAGFGLLRRRRKA